MVVVGVGGSWKSCLGGEGGVMLALEPDSRFHSQFSTSGCMTLGWLLNHLGPQFPHLYNKDSSCTCLMKSTFVVCKTDLAQRKYY